MPEVEAKIIVTESIKEKKKKSHDGWESKSDKTWTHVYLTFSISKQSYVLNS